MRSRYPSPVHFAAMAALLLVAAFAGCGGDDDDNDIVNPPAGAVEETVRIVNNASQQMGMAFTPNPQSVAVGTTVRWINNDGTNHTVTSDAGAPETFHLPVNASGQVIRKFNNAGTFPYHCAVSGHQMTAAIVVTP
jgi:plastocyanin